MEVTSDGSESELHRTHGNWREEVIDPGQAQHRRIPRDPLPSDEVPKKHQAQAGGPPRTGGGPVNDPRLISGTWIVLLITELWLGLRSPIRPLLEEHGCGDLADVASVSLHRVDIVEPESSAPRALGEDDASPIGCPRWGG